MATVQSGRTYIIINQKANTAADLSGKDQRSLIGFHLHKGDNQQWTFEQQGDGSWTIQNRHNHEYLNTDIPSVVSDGERVVTSKTPQSWDVQWDDQYQGYRILIHGSNTNIDLSNHGDPADGVPITLWTKWSGQNQVWMLEQV